MFVKHTKNIMEIVYGVFWYQKGGAHGSSLIVHESRKFSTHHTHNIVCH